MKTTKTLFICVKIIVILFCFFFSEITFSQVNWLAFPDTPVLSMNPASGMWGAYGQPTVIIHNDTFKMWYAVAEGENQFDPITRGRIHYAWSVDGVTWTKYPNNPVLDVSGSGQWDGQWLDTPEILWDGTEFKLYYYGDSTYYQGQDHTALGLATSPDGINWTRHGKVLEKGEQGDWDGHFIESPAAYYNAESGLYALLYTGKDTTGFVQLGLAVSMDGSNFIKYPDYPVIPVGNYPSWNDIAVAAPALIETNGIIEMWYSGVSFNNGQYDSARVGYAVTLNGVHWIQYPGNPVLTSDPEHTSSFWAVDVVWDPNDTVYKMYYEDFWLYGDSLNIDTVNSIFYATAPRDVLFSTNCNTNSINDTIISSGESIQLWATGGDYFSWDPMDNLSNPAISNPIASPDSTTTYTVLIVSNNCITKEEITVTVDQSSKIESNSSKGYVTVHPNPATISTKISTNIRFNNATFILFNSIGQVVATQNNVNSSEIIVQRENLKNGIYFFQIINDGEMQTGKFVIE